MALALHQNMVTSLYPFAVEMILRWTRTAEFRGPGVRHNFEDSGDDYDLDLDQRTRGMGGRSGRIILLGDGTEVLTGNDDMEMFDHEEEDKDLDSQVPKGQDNTTDDNRGAREETPGPEAPITTTKPEQSPESTKRNPFDTLSSSAPGSSESNGIKTAKVIPESALPDKLVTPPADPEK